MRALVLTTVSDGIATLTMNRPEAFNAFDAPIPAEQALAWGLATKVVARGSLHLYGVTKRLLTDSLDTSLETQLERERNGLATCAAHADGQVGLRAFAEKRKPVFS